MKSTTLRIASAVANSPQKTQVSQLAVSVSGEGARVRAVIAASEVAGTRRDSADGVRISPGHFFGSIRVEPFVKVLITTNHRAKREGFADTPAG